VVDMWLKSQCKDAKIVVNWGHRYVMCIMVTCKWYIYINKHIYIYVYIYISNTPNKHMLGHIPMNTIYL
jgi:hypothetical protein